MRRAAKVDANHAEIVKALRSIGCSVLDLSRVGQGCPDLLVAVRGQMILLECKLPRERLNARQQRFFGSWSGRCTIVRSAAEAVAVCERLGL